MVLDGATALDAPKDYKRKSESSRLTSYLKSALLRTDHPADTELFRSLSAELYGEGLFRSASAGLAGAAIEGDVVRFFSLGDCEVIYRLKSGEVGRVKREELDALDTAALERMKQVAREKGISIKESRTFITDILRSNRSMKNALGGYQVFEPLRDPSFTLYEKTYRSDEVDAFYVCSDGFSQCFTTLDIFPSCEALFQTEEPIESICKKIKSVSFSDPDFDRYPRFKIVDDITVIKVEF